MTSWGRVAALVERDRTSVSGEGGEEAAGYRFVLRLVCEWVERMGAEPISDDRRVLRLAHILRYIGPEDFMGLGPAVSRGFLAARRYYLARLWEVLGAEGAA